MATISDSVWSTLVPFLVTALADGTSTIRRFKGSLKVWRKDAKHLSNKLRREYEIASMRENVSLGGREGRNRTLRY
jgi:hypothetical protein